MKTPEFLLLIPMIILVALGSMAGCGGENSFSDDGIGEPPGGQAVCPCFSQDDVVNTAGQATNIECANTVFGLILLYNDPNSTGYVASCKSDGTGCSCSSPASGLQSATQAEYNACVNNLLNGLIRFNVPTVKVTGCSPG
jgi:hypothetical protein